MTIVALFHHKRLFPIMVSDFLLSHSGYIEESKPNSFPTDFTNSEYHPSKILGQIPGKYCRKIYVVHRHLAIGWSGSYIHAKILIRKIEQIASLDSNFIQQHCLEQILYLLDDSKKHVDCLFIAYDAINHRTITFSTSERKIVDSFYETIHVIGSGQNLIESYLQTGDAYFPSKEKLGVSQGIHVLLESRARSTAIVGSFIQAEILSPNPLYNYFGGGYQSIVFNELEGRFETFNSFRAVLWEYERRSDGKSVLSADGMMIFQNKSEKSEIKIDKYSRTVDTKTGYYLLKESFQVESFIDDKIFDCIDSSMSHWINLIRFTENNMMKNFIYSITIDENVHRWLTFTDIERRPHIDIYDGCALPDIMAFMRNQEGPVV
jgi:hypothetical protein